MRTRGTLYVVLTMLLACSSKTEKPAVCDGAPNRGTCLTEHYLQGYTPAPFPLCSGASKSKVGASQHVEFLIGEGVEDQEVQTAGRRLQRYYENYDLKFNVHELPGSVPFKYLLSGTEDAMKKRGAELGVDVTKEPTTEKEATLIEKVIGEVLGKNIRDTVKQGKAGPVDRIDIVVSDGIVDPAVQKIVAGEGVILGMGLSPTLFREVAAADASVNYFELYDLPPDFTPVFFVGQDDVRRLTPLSGDDIMAHEFGHALGLEHIDDTSDLMYPVADVVDCLPYLNDAQVKQLASQTGGTGTGASGTTTKSLSLWWNAKPRVTELPAFVRVIKAYAKALPQRLREGATRPAR